MRNDDPLPPFHMVGSTRGLLSDSEMDQLIAENESALIEGQLSGGQENSNVRRSQIVFFRIEEKNQWLFTRIWEAVREFNQRFVSASISGIEGNIQLARYDSSDHGFYNWHTDFGRMAPNRKISISIQLSRPEDYGGGDLELFFDNEPFKAERSRGTLIAFPSFVLHRVTPVTRGTRWSLVAWISGPRWS